VGAYQLDASDDLYLGSLNNASNWWPGDEGWMRVSDAILYNPAADFIAPERCIIPDIGANTQGLWVYEGEGATTGNRVGGTAGTLQLPTWDCDCPHTYGYTGPAPTPTPLSPDVWVENFAKTTDVIIPVTQKITLSFRPQLLFLWGGYQTAQDAVQSHMNDFFGFACEDSVGLVHQAAMAWADENGVSNDTDTAGGQSNSDIVYQVHYNDLNINRAQVSFQDDGFTLTWSVIDAGFAFRWGYAALRSSFITDAMIRHWQTIVGLGAQAVAGVPFQPDYLVDIGGMIFASIPSIRQSYYAGLGFYDGTNSFGSGWAHVNNYAPLGGVPKCLQHTTPFHYMPNSAAVPSVRNRFDPTSLDPAGFSVNHVNNFGTQYYHHTMCLEGSNVYKGSFTPGGPGAQNVVGVPFEPDIVLFHVNNIADGLAAYGSTPRPMFGAADKYLNNAAGSGYTHTINPTDVSSVNSGQYCITIIEPVNVLRAAATLTGMLANGFSLSWPVWVGATTYPVHYIAIKVD
jgi:hypothetical protein